MTPLRAVAVALAVSACGSPLAEPECRSLGSGRELCGPTHTSLTTEASDAAPVVQARLNGKPLRLIVDTGAEMTVISSTFLGAADQVVLRTHELCLGELCLRGEPVYAWETPFSSASADKTQGFIGMRTLKDFSLELDHGKRVMLTLGSAPCTGVDAPLGFTEYGIPTVPVSVASLPAKTHPIDSGSLFTVLSQATVDALPAAALGPSTPADLCTVDGCQSGVAQVAKLSEYCVASECETQLDVKFPVFDAVGASYLARRRIRFDFPGARLWSCSD